MALIYHVDVSDSLGRLLVDCGIITRAQLDSATSRQQAGRSNLPQTIIDLGYATRDQVLDMLGKQFGVPATRVNAYAMDREALKAVPEKIARQAHAFPLFRVGNTLTVAVADPRNLAALDALRFAAGCDVQPVVALEEEIGFAIDRFYRGELPIDAASAGGFVVLEESRSTLFERDREADESATRIVDQILARAAADLASDIHLEPQENGLRLRLRVDGVLAEVANLPKRLAPSVTARIKVMSGIDISEHRVPQDGRFSATVGTRRLDFRCATYPTVWGEKTVLRLLDPASLNVRLDEVGMTTALLDTYRELTRRPEGMILITGPTGSGKTSTLYATLRNVNERGLNIVTLENPVEYEIEGVNQGHVNEKAGFTFAAGFRAILRQDPDIILVGEIRDRETLDVAAEASLTGRLVFSTLHTNNAVGTVTRLIDMGMEPYLLVSSVIVIMAQRLARRVCSTCHVLTPTPPGLERFFLPGEVPKELARGAGCRLCNQTGYRGRVGLFEMLIMNDELRRLILQHASEQELETAARRDGFVTLRDEGIARVREGVTTLDEVLRTTQVRS
jgi:type IV pilus assembly protein PilB